MNKQTEELLDSLLKEIKTPELFHSVSDQLFKRGIQALLKAEMDVHLGNTKGQASIDGNIRNGYSEKTLITSEGEMTIQVPRDRQGKFDPVIIPKHKTMSQKMEDVMMGLYAKGMSTTDIVDFIQTTYGVEYSSTQVSLITNKLLEDIKEWQSRPLQSIYPIIWIDAIHYKIRQDGKVVSKAALIVLGIDLEGKQDILALHIIKNESSIAWAMILNDLIMRGVEDIFILCSDNLTGIQHAVESVLPQSVHQICIVHQIRNSLKHVSYKDRKKIIADMKKIYQADNTEQAKIALQYFTSEWSGKYKQAVNSWHHNWEALIAFLDFPAEIRKLIYTTNIIESFNASLRKYTRNKKIFPNDDSALKSIYLAAQEIKPKWNKFRFNWSKIYIINCISILKTVLSKSMELSFLKNTKYFKDSKLLKSGYSSPSPLSSFHQE